jgi:hypothetical protein
MYWKLATFLYNNTNKPKNLTPLKETQITLTPTTKIKNLLNNKKLYINKKSILIKKPTRTAKPLLMLIKTITLLLKNQDKTLSI